MVLSATDGIIVAAYFAVVFVIGFYFTRRDGTSRDYFLAGSDALRFAIGASIFVSNIGNEYLVDVAGSSAREGLAVDTYEMSVVSMSQPCLTDNNAHI